MTANAFCAVQPETCKHEGSEELCDGALCTQFASSGLHMTDMLRLLTIKATHKDGKEAGIELISPPAGSKPGDRVYFEGSEFESATSY